MNLAALLDARPERREDLGAWYARLLDAADREEVSVADLAEELGCSRETLYAWRRRFARSRAGARPPAVGLVRVEVTEPEPSPVSDVGRLEVRTRAGHTVLVPNDFDPSALAALVAVLERC